MQFHRTPASLGLSFLPGMRELGWVVSTAPASSGMLETICAREKAVHFLISSTDTTNSTSFLYPPPPRPAFQGALECCANSSPGVAQGLLGQGKQ